MKLFPRVLAAGCLAIVAMCLVMLAGCEEDSTSPGGTTVVPITDDIFPLTVGHKFTYTGYATAPGTGAQVPDPTSSYKTVWTIASNSAPSPLGGTATALIDSTTGPFGPGGAVVTVARTLLVREAVDGEFEFLQNIGPFKRAFGITVGTMASDTLKWFAVARSSQGVGATGATWTAFDSTFTGAGGSQVRLEIFGRIEAVETVTDSSASHTQHSAYRSRTWRRITVSGSVVQDDATTSRLHLVKDIGPVQVRIVEDTENLGHFRVLSDRNF